MNTVEGMMGSIPVGMGTFMRDLAHRRLIYCVCLMM